MPSKAICKYCGAVMEMQDHNKNDGVCKFEAWNFWCPSCGSESPMGKSKGDALKFAEAEPYQVPLTYDEAKSQRAIWMEMKNGSLKPIVIDFSNNDLPTRTLKDSYNTAWRAWLRWPTEKQRKLAKWETEK